MVHSFLLLHCELSVLVKKTQREYKTLTPYELTQLTKELFKKISSKCALFLTTANQDNIQFYIKTIKNQKYKKPLDVHFDNKLNLDTLTDLARETPNKNLS